MRRIAIRIAVLAAVLAVYFGIAAILPSGIESVVGFVAFATVSVGAFVWAMRDVVNVPLGDAIRDWLVIAFVVAVIWWVGLVLFEGSEDVVKQIRLNFLRVLSTVGLIFVPALFGLVLGHAGAGSESGPGDTTVEQ